MELLLFVLICYGLTQILVYGSIFNKVRPKHKFFHCAMCVGFWVGILVFNLMEFAQGFQAVGVLEHGVESFLMGCLSSGTSYALCSMVSDDGINIHKRG